MNIVVQKYGGTSLSAVENREKCLLHIKQELNKKNKLVVVISAMGRKNSPYSTDTLLSLLGDNVQLLQKDLDILLSTGEMISASVFSNLLHNHGISNTILTGGQAGVITDNNYNNANIISLNPTRLLAELKYNDVIIVPGFQGQTVDGDITTLGRGGSDTTATAIGSSINAKYVDIFTDVDGVMTADPRIVPQAKKINTMTYNEICNLANLGAKVIHPTAVEMAMKKNIPIRVRSTFNNEVGTIITNSSDVDSTKDNIIVGITQTADIVQFKVYKERYENIYKYMSQECISVDFIQITPSNALFTVPSVDKDKVSMILDAKHVKYDYVDNLSKVSIVGAKMSGVPGVMSKAVDSLYQQEIDVLQSSDSHTTIWFLINNEHMEKAVCSLHSSFIE